VPKKVIVIASGETERRALPYLLSHLTSENITVADIRIPPGNKALDVNMAERLIKASWFESIADPPDKFVILVDTDGKTPDDVLRPFRERLPQQLGPSVYAQIQFAYAKWHLEAWYFADISGLRQYLDRAPGSVDPSNPDEIENPKLHLKNLLADRAYTAVVSEEIARVIDPQTVAQRSFSFNGFLDAVRNGNMNSK
jgi:hypothetical protein